MITQAPSLKDITMKVVILHISLKFQLRFQAYNQALRVLYYTLPAPAVYLKLPLSSTLVKITGHEGNSSKQLLALVYVLQCILMN